MNTSPNRSKFSAKNGLLLGFFGSGVLIAGVLGWSVMASVSGAVIASGVVGVESRNQSLEHIDGGTISEILVRDGDRVEQGQVLVRFSDEKLRSEEAILLAQYVEFAARKNRLEAEFKGNSKIIWDDGLLKLTNENPDLISVIEGQESLFQARIAARDGEIKQIREQIGQAHNEITSLESRNASLRQQYELIVRELEAEQSLFDKGLSRLPRLLAVERAAQNLAGLIGSNNASLAGIRGSIAELEIQIQLVELRRVEEAEERASEVSAQENQILEQLAAIQDQLSRLEVKAPVTGVVFGLTVFAPLEVVFPGEPILQIVPEDARLVVIAKIQPIDIDQIYPQQQAILRFSAFPARETPEFDGLVKRIAADAVRDEVTGGYFYEIELILDQSSTGQNGKTDNQIVDGELTLRSLEDFTIYPGMPVEVHIRTIDRTVISYLLKPVSDFFYRSFREE